MRLAGRVWKAHPKAHRVRSSPPSGDGEFPGTLRSERASASGFDKVDDPYAAEDSANYYQGYRFVRGVT